jgi:hypothetical protein
MLYKIIYNDTRLGLNKIEVIDNDLIIPFKVLDIDYNASLGAIKVPGNISYIYNLIDKYIEYIEKYPSANEIIIYNSILSILLRSIKFSINFTVDKNAFKDKIKKLFTTYYKITALLALNMLEENLIISSLYSLFLYSKEIISPLPELKLPQWALFNDVYYLYPYLLEIKLDKALIAYKENVVLEDEKIKEQSKLEEKKGKLGILMYRAKGA